MKVSDEQRFVVLEFLQGQLCAEIIINVQVVSLGKCKQLFEVIILAQWITLIQASDS